MKLMEGINEILQVLTCVFGEFFVQLMLVSVFGNIPYKETMIVVGNCYSNLLPFSNFKVVQLKGKIIECHPFDNQLNH